MLNLPFQNVMEAVQRPDPGIFALNRRSLCPGYLACPEKRHPGGSDNGNLRDTLHGFYCFLSCIIK